MVGRMEREEREREKSKFRQCRGGGFVSRVDMAPSHIHRTSMRLFVCRDGFGRHASTMDGRHASTIQTRRKTVQKPIHRPPKVECNAARH